MKSAKNIEHPSSQQKQKYVVIEIWSLHLHVCVCSYVWGWIYAVFAHVLLRVDSRYHSSSAFYFLLEDVPIVVLEFAK